VANGSEPGITVGGIVVFLVIAGALGWLSMRMFVPNAPALNLKEGPATGTISPGWKLRTLDGKEVSVDAFAGKPLFINIWATWCGPCVSEMPSIERLYQSMQGKGVEFLIVSEEAPDQVARAVTGHGWKLPVFTTSELPSKLQTEGIPATFIVNGKGEVIFEHVGSSNWDTKETRDFLQRIQ